MLPTAFLLALFLLQADPSTATTEPEVFTVATSKGRSVEVSIHLPPDFEAASETEFNVAVGPGNYYWEGAGSHLGWIVATGEAFYGPDRGTDAPEVLEWLRGRYAVRGNGFHIVGWSGNSAGVFDLARSSPEDYLSVTGIAGMPGRGSEGTAADYKHLKVQFIVGEKDSYWRRGSEEWHERLVRAGVDSTLEIIPGGEHVMSELIGAPTFERLNRLLD